MRFVKLKIRDATPSHETMYVERSPGGKLHLVREKQAPPSPKSRDVQVVKVFEKLPEKRHVAVEAAEPKHKHEHHRGMDHEKSCRDGIRIEIIGFQNDHKQPRISISVGAGERSAARQPHPSPSPSPSPSPVVEVREPRHVKVKEKPHVELRKVKLEKVRPAEHRHRDIPVSPQPDAHRHLRRLHIKLPDPKPDPKPQPRHMLNDEIPIWDKDLRAWVVKRSPRVRFA
ncbi:hypothetical protein A1O3_04059 [Capronia epimyces CBS 606.96]|uniref:Uncharacterized protein n=1 Tax=Capronia epimyces CBS 606.96 TaxID=1182542 RepID=W9YCW7_9EURO|nr:uncharacterized protein A1O3_04059 [Capronia epimyces CBS 606.96]EXJ87101.1 hypothetical protein A1O3_04059 [Capronia epimyces CBS 606.96]